MNEHILAFLIGLTLALPVHGSYCSLIESYRVDMRMNGKLLQLYEVPSPTRLSSSEIHNCTYPGITNLVFLNGFFDDNRLATVLPKIGINKTNVQFMYIWNPVDLYTLSPQFFHGFDTLISFSIISGLRSVTGDIYRPTLFRGLDISEDTFSGLVKLEFLQLRSSKITELRANVFSSLINLQELSLSYNSIGSLSNQMFDQNILLRTVDLSGNQLQLLPSKIFDNLRDLERLDLSDNWLSQLDDGMFRSNFEILSINLSSNKLHIVSVNIFRGLRHLEQLDLSSNYLNSLSGVSSLSNHMHFPAVFNVDDLSVLPNDITVDLSDNKIETIIVQAWMYTNVIVKLSGNPIKCDCRLYSFLDQFRNHQYLFPYLLIDGFDNMTCTTPFELKHTPLPALILEELQCSASPPYGECGKKNKCQCIFRPFSNTLTVDCSAKFLRHGVDLSQLIADNPLSNRTYNQMMHGYSQGPSYPNFIDLDLRNNRLPASSLAHVTSLSKQLKFLDLSLNAFENIPASFLLALDQSDTWVDLSNNPFMCNCQLIPFYKYMQSKSPKVTHIQDVVCQGYNVSLENLSERDFCSSLSSATQLPLALPMLGAIAVLVGAALILNYKTSIFNWLNEQKMHFGLPTELEMDVVKTYDAFICYAHEDDSFVMDELVQRLENGDPKYRVCLHTRDWIPGELIATQIVNSVNSSQMTLVVLSQNFIRSMWTNLEFRQACKQKSKDNTSRVIVILYGEIPPEDQMDEELVSYIKLHTYLDWASPNFWDQLQCAMPHPI